MTFTLNEFTIDPSHCEVIYSCVNVTRLDSVANTFIDCEDLPFDGNFDGSIGSDNAVSDGKMTFTATQADYENDIYPPGEYQVTIKGRASASGEE